MLKRIEFNNCAFEVLLDGDTYLGLGEITIGDTVVRSGRLPIDIKSDTFTGLKLSRCRFLGIDEGVESVKINLEAEWIAQQVLTMRDHSFDPIHNMDDWDDTPVLKTNALSIVIEKGSYHNSGYDFYGFSYYYEFFGDVEMYHILERSSWELDGDIVGATCYSQSACSDPVVTFAQDNFWTTEGKLFFLDESSVYNRVMTHNLPRWASHQWFDYQFKEDKTLISLFDRVDLIRTVLLKEEGKSELKTFEKYIFDATCAYKTPKKSILLNKDHKSKVDEQNLWTWIFDDTAEQARAEFGIKETPPHVTTHGYYENGMTIDTYYKDILPVSEAVGVDEIYLENQKRADANVEKENKLKAGNVCTSHEYVIAESVGGIKKLKEYIDRCKAVGIKNFMWTNTLTSFMSDTWYNHCNVYGEERKSWFIVLEDTRLFSAGAYTMVGSSLDMSNKDAWNYFVDSHIAIAKESGLEGYFIDSFYNLFFMPVSYKDGKPKTIWRESLLAIKKMQDAGLEFSIESFGPFGQIGHGHPSSYDATNIAFCYLVGMGNDYCTIPVPGVLTDKNTKHDPGYIYYQLAHKCMVRVPFYIDGVRTDKIYTPEHKLIFGVYKNLLYTEMHKRFMQEDNNCVIYHNKAGDKAYIWNFVERDVALDGEITDLMTGERREKRERYTLLPRHTYMINGTKTLIKDI